MVEGVRIPTTPHPLDTIMYAKHGRHAAGTQPGGGRRAPRMMSPPGHPRRPGDVRGNARAGDA